MHKRPAFAPQKERPAKAGRLIMRHDDAERDVWQRRADQCGLSLSEFMRQAANHAAGIEAAPRKRPVRSADDPVAYALLKIGNNVNQQAHALNTAALAGEAPSPALSASVLETHSALRALLAQLADESAGR